jgi:AraC family transcriptional regulator
MARGQEPDRVLEATPGAGSAGEMSVVASTTSAGWTTVLGSVVDSVLPEFVHQPSPHNLVSFLLSGTTMVEWKRGVRFTRYLSEPGSSRIVPSGDDHYFRTDRRTRSLNWQIEPDRLQAMVEQAWGSRAPKVEIREAFNNRDAEFWALGQRLATQILSPMPGSRLYAESLDTQIALHLLWNHSSLARREETRVEPLTDARLRRVIDYIHDSLGNEISLGELADLAGLSPNYFLGAFRRATGKTPHRYLTEERVSHACTLLKNPHHSLVSVALAVGFSSQSHLTTVFRRFMRTTPAAYRDEVLGLNLPEPKARGRRAKADSEEPPRTVRNGRMAK